MTTEAGPAPPPPPLALDTHRLSAWLHDAVPGFAGPLQAERFAGGQSNPTYKLTTPGARYVLRRKPPGKLLPGAHAIEREAAIMSALEPTGVRVPHIHALCTDPTIIGSEFYVMAMVEGRIFWDATFPSVSTADRPAYFDAMNATIARLHGIDYRAVGLADYGRPGNYFARQIARWTKQYLEAEEAGRDPNMDRLIEWLPAHIPNDDETTLVHGDFRCDNMIFHPTEPRILAVLDWELSTLGHPLSDFAYHAMMYQIPPNIVAGLSGANLAALNIPTEQQYLDTYLQRRGRTSADGYLFCLAFNFFRLAAIIHGIKSRVARGNAASPDAATRVAALPHLAELAWHQAERAG